jgi:hypothetical protein
MNDTLADPYQNGLSDKMSWIVYYSTGPNVNKRRKSKTSMWQPIAEQFQDRPVQFCYGRY